MVRGHLIPVASGYAVVLHSTGAAADVLCGRNPNAKEEATAAAAAAAVVPADEHRKEELCDGIITVSSHPCSVGVDPCI